MKKTFLFIVSFLLCSCLAYGQGNIMPYSFTFTGKWNPTENPILLDDNGIQDIQNLRKSGKHFKGVSGHTAINSTALSTYPFILNGFHFKKDQPSESHVVTYATDAFSPTAGRLYQNTTAIPSAGDFSATVLYTPTTFTNMWRFSSAPDGNMLASNGNYNLIWGGNEMPATSFITSSAAVDLYTTNKQDYSDVLSKNNTSNSVVITNGIDSYVKLLLHMNGTDASTTFTDSSSGTKAMTAVGNAQIDTAQYKLGTASGLFDGTGDYLTTPDSDDWYFAADPFTIDFWVKVNDTTAGIVGQWADANNYWFIDILSGKLRLHGFVSGTTIFVHYQTTDAVISTGTWYHVAVVRNGTSVYMFVDGVSKALTATYPIGSGSFPNMGSVLYVGATAGAGSSATETYINGWIDEFRLSKGIARWTADFTPRSREYNTASNYWMVGSKRPLQGVKFYIGTANTMTSTMTVKRWIGNAWDTITATDNTAAGGVSLAQTGTVTWTLSTAEKPRFIEDISLYWYQFTVDAVDGVSLYYVTVDAPIQQIKNDIWNGYTEKSFSAQFNSKDYTADLGDESINTYADVSSWSTSQYMYLGFTSRQQALEFYVLSSYENSNSATVNISYWNGSTWISCPKQHDGTAISGATFAQYGIVAWSPPTDEVKTNIAGNGNYYYYRVSVSASLDSSVRFTEVRGITQPDAITGYMFSQVFQNRVFLFNEKTGARNKALYSNYNAPEIFNGSDSGSLILGDLTDITAATVIYNVFMSEAIDQMIMTKTNETWRLSGADVDEWKVQRMSANIGCVAPLSMVSAEVAESSANVKRTVAIWQFDKGVVMSDGAIIVPISDDIKCYWDPRDSRYIPTAMQPKSVGWYDAQNQSYKLLIASGSSATYLNTELEYSLQTKEWTKVYRENASGANPLQSGWVVYDTNGLQYTYGGGKDGLMYRLENGNSWNAVANIAQYIQTKDLVLDNERPMFRKGTVRNIRTLYKKKTAATGNLTITHYCDQSATSSGNGQTIPAAISTIPTTLYNTQSVSLGPCLYHSFKFSQTTNAADGLELLGFGIYYEPYTTFR